LFKEWRKKSDNLMGTWPAGRSYHSATHLCFDEDHQMLLVIGAVSIIFYIFRAVITEFMQISRKCSSYSCALDLSWLYYIN